jgi:hypothetical protein
VVQAAEVGGVTNNKTPIKQVKGKLSRMCVCVINVTESDLRCSGGCGQRSAAAEREAV